MNITELAEILGEDVAMSLICRNPGKKLHVPIKLKKRIIDVFSGDVEAAKKMIEARKGEIIVIPSAPRWKAQYLFKRGMNMSDIAVTLQMSLLSVKHQFKKDT
jgi:hypothetical protein